MTQPHDTHIGRQILLWNLNQLQTITADKGYDGTICVRNFGRPVFGQ